MFSFLEDHANANKIYSNVRVKRKRREDEERGDVVVSSKLRATNDRNAESLWHFQLWQRSAHTRSKKEYYIMCEDTKENRPGVECRHPAGDEKVAYSP